MYTQCPECLTIYPIDEELLQSSLGIVRCGHCQARFDALRTLTDTLPSQPNTPLPDLDPMERTPVLIAAVPASAFGEAARKRARLDAGLIQWSAEDTDRPPDAATFGAAPRASNDEAERGASGADWFAEIESEIAGNPEAAAPRDVPIAPIDETAASAVEPTDHRAVVAPETTATGGGGVGSPSTLPAQDAAATTDALATAAPIVAGEPLVGMKPIASTERTLAAEATATPEPASAEGVGSTAFVATTESTEPDIAAEAAMTPEPASAEGVGSTAFVATTESMEPDIAAEAEMTPEPASAEGVGSTAFVATTGSTELGIAPEAAMTPELTSTEGVDSTESVITTEGIASTGPVANAKPVVAAKLIVIAEPVGTGKPAAAQPLVARRAVASTGPLAAAKPVVAAKLFVSVEPVVAREPVVTTRAVASTGPLAGAKPVVPAEIIVTTEPVAAPEPVAATASIAVPEMAGAVPGSALLRLVDVHRWIDPTASPPAGPALPQDAPDRAPGPPAPEAGSGDAPVAAAVVVPVPASIAAVGALAPLPPEAGIVAPSAADGTGDDGAVAPDGEVAESAPVYIRPRPRRSPAGVAWGVGCAVLALVLAAQIAWASRVALFRDPATRPFVSQVCRSIPCRLPPIKDTAKIELLSRDVRPDPGAEGALMITASIRNDATFRQPWPVVVVELTDVDNHVVAMRRFRPAEYLPDAARRAAGLGAGTTAAVAFAVIDPGQRASGFHFSFE